MNSSSATAIDESVSAQVAITSRRSGNRWQSTPHLRSGRNVMMQHVRRIGFGLFTTLAIFGLMGQAPAAAQERFEVTSIKAVRPHLVNTVAALQQRDVANAKAAFEAYDSGWNGIEMYINTRSRPLYQALEIELQAKVTKALEGPNPDLAAVLADARALLAKYDEAISLVEKAAPLNALYDDGARLRIAR